MVVMGALQFGSAMKESATYDEAVHLSAGYRYWRTGNFILNSEHPPLQKLLSALPLLALRPPMPDDPKLLIDQSDYARVFLYNGPFPADRLLMLGRLPTMVMSLLLLASVAWAARHFFGAAAGVCAVWLCALDPNLIAHGRYVTTDLISALFFFLTVVAWVRYLQTPSAVRALWTALALGAALSAKFSMLILPGLLAGMLALHWLMVRDGWRAAAKRFGTLIGVLTLGSLLLAASYGPESWRVFRGRKIEVEPTVINGVTMPRSNYLTGLLTVMEHNRTGHAAYLFGEVSLNGWWYYFPVVFVLKSTVALLLLFGAGLWVGVRHVPLLFRRPGESFVWVGLLAPPLLYFGATMTSHIDLGVRYLLPVYPFLYVLGAAALVRTLPPRTFTMAAAALLTLQAAETIPVYPEYLAFFNTPAGGRKAGPDYLLDSNVDWGQDLKKFKTYQDQHPGQKLCLCYFGSPEPDYYGIQYDYLPRTKDKDERERADCIGAISVTLLHDLYIEPGSYEWLRQKKPIGLVGSSIYLYDLRQPAAP